MARAPKRCAKKTPSAKDLRNERRRVARYLKPATEVDAENDKVSARNARNRLEARVQTELRKEQTKFPLPNDLSEDVAKNPLVQALMGGYLEELKGIRLLDSSLVVDILMNPLHPWVYIIQEGLKDYEASCVERTDSRMVSQFQDCFDGKFTYHLFHVCHV